MSRKFFQVFQFSFKHIQEYYDIHAYTIIFLLLIFFIDSANCAFFLAKNNSLAAIFVVIISSVYKNHIFSAFTRVIIHEMILVKFHLFIFAQDCVFRTSLSHFSPHTLSVYDPSLGVIDT